MDRQLDELRQGKAHRFAEFATASSLVPRAGAGIYTVWDESGELIYVGIAGRNPDGTGLASRLRSHASGRRSGDQFCVYVADHYVMRNLTRQQIEAIRDGGLSMDLLVRDWINKHFAYRFAAAATYGEAMAIENASSPARSGRPHGSTRRQADGPKQSRVKPRRRSRGIVCPGPSPSNRPGERFAHLRSSSSRSPWRRPSCRRRHARRLRFAHIGELDPWRYAESIGFARCTIGRVGRAGGLGVRRRQETNADRTLSQSLTRQLVDRGLPCPGPLGEFSQRLTLGFNRV